MRTAGVRTCRTALSGPVRSVLTVVGLALLVSPAAVDGQTLTGHYSPGLFGLRSAHSFPMGFSYLNVTNIYYAGEVKDNDGQISTLAKPVSVVANINGVLWGRRVDALKANFNAGVAVPIANLALNPETLDLDPERVGISDIFLIPALLSWDFGRVVTRVHYGLFLPTGSFAVGSVSNRGKGFWTHALASAVTAYLDPDKAWHASVHGTYEIHTKQKESDIKPGQNIVIEWGVGRTWNNAFNMGLIGHNVFQTTDQVNADGSGTGLKKYRVNGIGAEFGYRTASRWAFITRWYLEYAARNRPEGTTIRFVVLKNF